MGRSIHLHVTALSNESDMKINDAEPIRWWALHHVISNFIHRFH